MLLMISFRLLMYSCFCDSLCSRGGKCLVCQSNDFWKVVFTGLNGSTESRVREALKLNTNLIRFSISAGDFCPFFRRYILIKTTALQFMFYSKHGQTLRKSFLYYTSCSAEFVVEWGLVIFIPLQPLVMDLYLQTLKTSWIYCVKAHRIKILDMKERTLWARRG